MTARKHPKHWKMRTVHTSELGEFRDVHGTGGLYKISRDGVVISKRRKSLPEDYWVVLGVSKSRVEHPFQRVTIYYDDKARMCQISRLLLEAWVGPAPSNAHVAAHRNGLSDDDRLDNLMWALPQDVKHGSICRGTWVHGENCHSARVTGQRIEAIRKLVVDYKVPITLIATALGERDVRVREWIIKTWDDAKWDGLQNPLLQDTGV